MKIDNSKWGGEQDFCECGVSGDDSSLMKVKGTPKFICESCHLRYEEAKETIAKLDRNYKKKSEPFRGKR